MMGTIALLLLLAWLVSTAIMTFGAARITPEQAPAGASSTRHTTGAPMERAQEAEEC
jgi:hypothetical protein